MVYNKIRNIYMIYDLSSNKKYNQMAQYLCPPVYAVNDLVFTKYLALNTMRVFDFSRVLHGARCQVALDRAVYC